MRTIVKETGSNPDILNGKARFIQNYGFNAATDLNTAQVGPEYFVEDWVASMPGYARWELNSDFGEYAALFTDGSRVVWLDSEKEWGFTYGFSVSPLIYGEYEPKHAALAVPEGKS